MTVPPGYPRCPKCQALMPGAPETALRKAGARSQDAGGTSVSGRPRWVWPAAAGAGVIALMVTVAILAGGSEPAAGPEPAGQEEAEDGQTPGAAGAPAGTGAGPGAGAAPGRDDDVAERRGEALRSLRIELERARLWSQVAEDPADDSTAVLRTSECEQAELVLIVDAAAGALRAAGVTAVRCVEPHGAVVFERQL